MAHVKIMVEPNEPGKGYEFINKIVGGAIPKEYIPCCGSGHPGRDAGRRACRLSGRGREGHAATTARITRSTRLKWRLRSAAAWHLRRPCQKAGPTLLEPIMKVVVTAPEELYGRRYGRSQRPPRPDRRARTSATARAIVTANVPLASMFGYATDLRSKTQGRAHTTAWSRSHYRRAAEDLFRRRSSAARSKLT